MVDNKSLNARAEREKLVVNLEQHRQMKEKMLAAIENLRRVKAESLTLQQESQHLVAQPRGVTKDL